MNGMEKSWIHWGVQGVVGLLIFIGWFLFLDVRKAVDANSDLIKKIEIELPKEYVRQTDMKDLRREILGALERIEQKLDKKEDKQTK